MFWPLALEKCQVFHAQKVGVRDEVDHLLPPLVGPLYS